MNRTVWQPQPAKPWVITVPDRVLSRIRTLEVVTGSLQLQDERVTHDADTAHQFAAHLSQGTKHVLDPGSRHGDRAVAPLLRLENASGRVAASLNMHAPPGLFQSGFAFDAGIATVGIDIPARVAQVEQLLEDRGVGYGSMGHGDLWISLQRLSTLACSLYPK